MLETPLKDSILWPTRLPQDALENKRSTQAQEKLRMKQIGILPTRKHANNFESVVGLSRSQLQAGLPRGPGEQRPPPTHGKMPHQPYLGDSYPTAQAWHQPALSADAASNEAASCEAVQPGKRNKTARAFSL